VTGAPRGIPLPRPTALSRPHWDGCAEGRLRVQRCAACARYVFIPQPFCPECQRGPLAWVDSTGRGTVYSYTIVHRAPRPEFAVPYVVAIVELEEGWHMLSNVVGCAPEALRVGLPVEVVFEREGDVVLPRFRPSGEDPRGSSRS
jgi:uncharacterized OB-fold protein